MVKELEFTSWRLLQKNWGYLAERNSTWAGHGLNIPRFLKHNSQSLFKRCNYNILFIMLCNLHFLLTQSVNSYSW